MKAQTILAHNLVSGCRKGLAVSANPFRREKRHRLEADIRVIADDGSAVALSTLDISCAGLATDGLVQFEPEAKVRVEFPEGTVRAGRTKWREDFSSGILFDTPFSPDELEALRAVLVRKPYFAEQRG